MELIVTVKNCLSDEFIFGTIKLLKNEYSVISSMVLFPTAIWLWKKIKKVTPWADPDINGSEHYEIRPTERN